MVTLRTIDCLMIRVTDLERSVQFYEQRLGMTRAWTDEEREMVGFTFSESTSEIVLHKDPAIPDRDVSFLVDDVAKACAEHAAAGGKILVEPKDVRCGKFAVLADPDGNPLPIIDWTSFDGEPRYDDPKPAIAAPTAPTSETPAP